MVILPIDRKRRYETVKKGFENIKTMVTMAGILLWIGAVSPEIFIESGMGCIKDSNGNELTRQESQELLEQILYGDELTDENTIVYKSKILEWFYDSMD